MKDDLVLDYSKIEAKRERKLTLKQRRWIKEYIKTGNATEAARRVYNCRSKASAEIIAHENLQKLDYGEMMEMAGVSDKALNEALLEGLKATGVTKHGDVPDYATRHRYLETALKLKKRLGNRLEVTGENGQPIRINVLAGHGFIPNVSKSRPSNAPPKAGTASGAPKVQDAALAPPRP